MKSALEFREPGVPPKNSPISVELELTPEQQEQYSQANGLVLKSLQLTPQALCGLLLLAEVSKEGRLPTSHRLTITARLTLQQQKQIRQVTGRDATHIALPFGTPDLVRYTEDWREDFAPIPIGRSLIIMPAVASDKGVGSKHVVKLVPGAVSSETVFGTGMHPTTQLALVLLEDWLSPGDRVLDLGTGSGILAIAAARLGASEVLAVDTDATAVAVAQRNVTLNGVAGTVQVREGSVEATVGRDYDLVVANLLAGVLLRIAPPLAGVVRPHGILIASGIRTARREALADALVAEGLRLENEQTRDGWIGMAFRRI